MACAASGQLIAADTGAAGPFPATVALTDALRSIGGDQFYPHLAKLIGAVIPAHNWIVAEYSRQARPTILSDNWLSREVKARYFDDLYDRDPLQRFWRGRAEPTAVSLNSIRATDGIDHRYSEYLDNVLKISDELALLLPISSESCVALCLDRVERPFSENELNEARELWHALYEMHKLHLRHNRRLGVDAAVQHFAVHFALTPREFEIVMLILEGYSNANIAKKLGISLGVVKNHKHRLYRKLDVTSEREVFSLYRSA